MTSPEQVLPVRLYQTSDRLMVATPMPGLEPEDITVTIAGDRVTIRAERRGPHQDEMDMLVTEWTIGPYCRELDLAHPVNGPLTNATYGNGVLVLSMPKVATGQAGVPAEIRLDAVESTRGERVGHVGRRARPTPAGSHRHSRSESAPILTDDERALLRETLEMYLADFRRQVAAAENPDFREQLQVRQNALERIVERLSPSRAA